MKRAGAPPLVFQWQRSGDDGSTFTDIPGYWSYLFYTCFDIR